MVKRIPTSKFGARCLDIVAEVREKRIPVFITEAGRAIAKIVPVESPTAEVFGCMIGTARIVGDIVDPIW
jgi:prevent-host-death family protein